MPVLVRVSALLSRARVWSCSRTLVTVKPTSKARATVGATDGNLACSSKRAFVVLGGTSRPILSKGHRTFPRWAGTAKQEHRKSSSGRGRSRGSNGRRVHVQCGILSAAAFGVTAAVAADLLDGDNDGNETELGANDLDVVVIGGGIVGLAVARELVVAAVEQATSNAPEDQEAAEEAQPFRLALLEQASSLGTGATSGNSGIGCTGYDAPEDSLERALLRRSIVRHQELYRSLGLSYDHIRQSGALVVAWTKQELERLPTILKENHEAGDTDARLLSRSELLDMEPTISPDALGAVLLPREKVVEPWLIPRAYAASAMLHGANLRTNCQVQQASFDEEARMWNLDTSQGRVRARTVINCAGLFGDDVQRMAFPDAEALPFEIRPRKGQFVVFEQLPEHQSPTMVIEPVPTQRTKGVIVWASMYGNIVVGPTADDQQSKTDRTTDEETVARLREYGARVLPALRDANVVGTYSGIRPATEHRDFVIQALPHQNWITVGGIRSTGLTAASGIAEHVSALYQRCVVRGEEPPAPGEALVEWQDISPPFAPVELSPKPKFHNPKAPSLPELAANYRERGDGTVRLFDKVYKVTHPLCQFGMKTMKLPEDTGEGEKKAQ